MKVLITTDWYRPVVNGVVTSVINLANGLEELGHEVRILTLSGNIHSYREGNITYIGSVGVGIIYPDARLKMALTHKLIKELIDWNPDIVHSQCEFSTFFLAKKIAEFCHAPLVHTYHTVYEDYTHYFSPNVRFGKYLAAVFTRKVLSDVQAVIAPTDKVRKILENYQVDTRISTIPSGLELNHFSYTMAYEERKKQRTSLGITEQEKVLVYVGRLAKEKNIDELLCLISQEACRNIRLLIVGDGPYRASLEELAANKAISDRVIFTGMVSPDKVADYYKIGDIFVSSSQSETQGLTYIEAMASGLPILCKQDSALNGIIENGRNGFVYTTPVEFGEYVDRLLSDYRYKDEIANYAVQTVYERFSSAGFARSVVDLYLSVG